MYEPEYEQKCPESACRHYQVAPHRADKKARVGESADLLYHLLGLLESREVTLDEVFEELERRMALTAVGEKRQKTASR